MVEAAKTEQRVVITGIATAIGQRVAELLVRQGHQVFGIDRRPLGAGPPASSTSRSTSASAPPKRCCARCAPTWSCTWRR
jgi:NAD(P)-dependent dehydrogenase (short-subunit alcohol dehydrogenase family)